MRVWSRFRGRRAAPARHTLFCALGGSGSSALRKALERSGRFARVGNRPDVPFLPEPCYTVCYEPGRQRLDERGLAARPTPSAAAEFHRRSGARLDPERSIGEGLERYVTSLPGLRQGALLNTAATLGFFSERGIRNVTFLVRHPLHAYGSWVKAERHLGNIERVGGPDSERSVEFWADLWSASVREYCTLRDKGLEPVLLRFEHAAEDAGRAGAELGALFGRWDPSKRNPGVLRPDLEALMRERTAEGFAALYADWEV